MNKKSFTLIELLVVIAIIGILSSLVIARFSDWGDNARIANALQWSAGVHRTLGANLVGHWPLNGNLKDISGYDNHGLWEGTEDDAPTENWVDGVSGTGNQALYFNGIDDYIDLGYTSVNTSNPFTYSVWVNVHEFPELESFLLAQQVSGFWREPWVAIRSTQKIRFGNAYDGVYSSQDSIDYLNINEWYLIQTVYTGNRIIIYLNSEESGNKNVTLIFDNTEDNLLIGKRPTGYNFEGLVSDLRIYNAALTAEEVSRILCRD